MSAQPLVGAAGVGLIVANYWTGPQKKDLSGLFGGDSTDRESHAAVKQLGAELLFVTVLVLLAGVSDGAGHAALAVLACLWIVWALRRTPST